MLVEFRKCLLALQVLMLVIKAFRNCWTGWMLDQMKKTMELRKLMTGVVEVEHHSHHSERIKVGLRNFRLGVLEKLNQAVQCHSS